VAGTRGTVHELTPSGSRPTPPSRDSSTPRPVALVGPGRAGRAICAALRRAGWPIVAVAGRSIDAVSTQDAAIELDAVARAVDDAARAAEVILIATPDAAIATVAAAVVGSAVPGALAVHLAGSRGLKEFAAAAERRPDVRFAALHPLVSIPSPDPRHLTGGWCAVAGDPDVYELAGVLGLQPFTVSVADRSRYHASATIAANHLVALLGQVERLSEGAGVPFDAFYPLVRGVLDNCEALGPRAALTGPVARGDAQTIAAHLAALPAEERALYRSLAAEALRLSGRDDPELAAWLR
jgi:predicted short-subunit dehydrogenase-like oxidoreductase (DUF2520 family)